MTRVFMPAAKNFSARLNALDAVCVPPTITKPSKSKALHAAMHACTCFGVLIWSTLRPRMSNLQHNVGQATTATHKHTHTHTRASTVGYLSTRRAYGMKQTKRGTHTREHSTAQHNTQHPVTPPGYVIGHVPALVLVERETLLVDDDCAASEHALGATLKTKQHRLAVARLEEVMDAPHNVGSARSLTSTQHDSNLHGGEV